MTIDKQLVARLAREAVCPLQAVESVQSDAYMLAAMQRFAALVAEECAKVADGQKAHAEICAVGGLRGAKESAETAAVIAEAIRAKFALAEQRVEG